MSLGTLNALKQANAALREALALARKAQRNLQQHRLNVSALRKQLRQERRS